MIVKKSVLILSGLFVCLGITQFFGIARADIGNIADKSLGVSATASVEFQGYGPEKAIDGINDDYNNYWSSLVRGKSSLPAWLKIDLGAVNEIEKVVIYFHDQRWIDFEYTIEVSLDDQNWKTVVPKKMNGGMVTEKFKATEARYVRLTVTYESKDDSTAYVMEMEVYQPKGATYNKPELNQQRPVVSVDNEKKTSTQSEIPFIWGGPKLNNVKTLEAIVWPNYKRGQLSFVTGLHQAVYFMMYNRGSEVERDIQLVIDVPQGIEIVDDLPMGSKVRAFSKSSFKRDGLPYSRFTFVLDQSVELKQVYSDWPSSHMMLFVFSPLIEPGEYELFCSIKSAVNIGEEFSIPITIHPLPSLPPRREEMTIGIWMNDPKFNQVLEEQIVRDLAKLGVNYLILGDKHVPKLANVAQEQNVQILVGNWWHYATVLPVDPPLEAQGVKVDGTKVSNRWSPTYIAQRGPAFMNELNKVVQTMKDIADKYPAVIGFKLDLEPGAEATQIDYSDDSRQAFQNTFSLTDLQWPKDVMEGGRYYLKWIEFRCQQTVEYTKILRDSLKATMPNLHYGLSTSGFTPNPYDPNKVLAATDVKMLIPIFDSMHPQLYSWAQDESNLTRHQEKIQMGTYTIEAADGKPIYPTLGSTASTYPYTDPKFLNIQALDHIAEGAKGLDFWQFYYGMDGEYYLLFAKLANIFDKVGDYINSGCRKDKTLELLFDTQVALKGYAYYKTGEEPLLIILNHGSKSTKVTYKLNGYEDYSGINLLTGEVLGKTVEVPPYDGLFIILNK